MPILRKLPTQQRSRRTVDIILKAATQILEKMGEDALTTSSVAERAGVSIGTLYQYFADRDSILSAIASHEHESLVNSMMKLIDAIESQSTNDPQREFVRAVIASYSRRRTARRLFALMVRLRAPDGEPLREEVIRRISKFWSHRDGGQRPLTNKTHAYVMVRSIVAVVQGAAIDNPAMLKDPDFEDALCLIISGFGAHQTSKRKTLVAKSEDKSSH